MEAAEDGREAPPPIAPEAEAQPQQSQQAPASPPPVRRIFSCLAPAGAGAAAAEPLVYLEPPSQPGLAFFERGAAREGPGTVTVQWTTTGATPDACELQFGRERLGTWSTAPAPVPILGPDRRSRRPLQRETRWEAEVRDWPLDRVIVFRARAWRGEARSEWSSKGRSRVQKWYTREQAARDSLENGKRLMDRSEAERACAAFETGLEARTVRGSLNRRLRQALDDAIAKADEMLAAKHAEWERSIAAAGGRIPSPLSHGSASPHARSPQRKPEAAGRTASSDPTVRTLTFDTTVRSRPQPEPEPEPEPEPAALPTAEEYCRHGISIEGLEHFLAQHPECGQDGVTTSDVCHTVIKPATVPVGWENLAVLINPEKRWYSHTYRRNTTGTEPWQPKPPPGTMSYCEKLLNSLDSLDLKIVGRPTVFVSHAWTYVFKDIVGALRAYVDELPPGSPAVFFWFDTFCIDEHATQSLPQDWWGTTFKEAIRLIGSTAMVLSPWDNPLPLTRSWCLWEIFCTVATGSKFSVCLGPAEEAAFEAALLGNAGKGFESVQAAFTHIDVEKAEAGNPADQEMILNAAREAPGGTEGINAVACDQLRAWTLDKVQWLVARKAKPGRALVLETKQACAVGHQVAVVLGQAGRHAEAKPLWEAVVAGRTALHGPDHEATLGAQSNLAITLLDLGEVDRARALYEAVLERELATLGPAHDTTLRTQLNLAVLLKRSGDYGGARALEEAVVAGRTELNGAAHASTLLARMNLANTLRKLGDHGAARAEYAAVLAAQKETLGPRHPSTLHTQGNLAVLLGDELGEVGEACTLMREVVAAQTAVLGAEHERTRIAARFLAKWEAQLKG